MLHGRATLFLMLALAKIRCGLPVSGLMVPTDNAAWMDVCLTILRCTRPLGMESFATLSAPSP